MREEGMSLGEAVLKAGVARFRPILLTSLTTFVGLMPLILEKKRSSTISHPHGHFSGLWGDVCHSDLLDIGAHRLPVARGYEEPFHLG